MQRGGPIAHRGASTLGNCVYGSRADLAHCCIRASDHGHSELDPIDFGFKVDHCYGRDQVPALREGLAVSSHVDTFSAGQTSDISVSNVGDGTVVVVVVGESDLQWDFFGEEVSGSSDYVAEGTMCLEASS